MHPQQLFNTEELSRKRDKHKDKSQPIHKLTNNRHPTTRKNMSHWSSYSPWSPLRQTVSTKNCNESFKCAWAPESINTQANAMIIIQSAHIAKTKVNIYCPSTSQMIATTCKKHKRTKTEQYHTYLRNSSHCQSDP